MLSVAMNVLAGLTGTAWGGMAIVLNAFGGDFMRLATEHGIYPDLMQASKSGVTNLTAATLNTAVIRPAKNANRRRTGSNEPVGGKCHAAAGGKQ